jgi:hypothetical protein
MPAALSVSLKDISRPGEISLLVVVRRAGDDEIVGAGDDVAQAPAAARVFGGDERGLHELIELVTFKDDDIARPGIRRADGDDRIAGGDGEAEIRQTGQWRIRAVQKLFELPIFAQKAIDKNAIIRCIGCDRCAHRDVARRRKPDARGAGLRKPLRFGPPTIAQMVEDRHAGVRHIRIYAR